MLAFVAALGLTLFALLLVPVQLRFAADPQAEPQLRAEWSWLFGLVHAPIKAKAQSAARSKQRKRRTRGGVKRGLQLRQGLAFLRGFGGILRVQALVSDLVESLDPRVETLTVRWGLDDPADTGQAWAVVGPASAWLVYRFGGQITIEPSFTEPTFSLEGRAALTLIPARTLAVAFGYLLSAGTLRGIYLAHQAG